MTAKHHGSAVNLIPIWLCALDIPTHISLSHRFDLFVYLLETITITGYTVSKVAAKRVLIGIP
eukprot:scaffold3998_cov153-Skeletonema_dohrnii-CCMP3373.AAC.13